MNLRIKLSRRICMGDIFEIAHLAQTDEKQRKELYDLAFDEEDSISINALWIMTHFSPALHEWLCSKQNELIDLVLVVKSSSQRRLILSLLLKQPLADPIRVDFLDFCLGIMLSQKEPHGVTTLCMKLAYEMCRSIPELLPEYRATLDTMEPAFLPPSLQTARKNILKIMQKRKELL